MKKFLIYIIVFFAIVVVLDITYGKVCDYMFTHAKGGVTKANYYIARESHEPIIMMGSSRMHHHYDPLIIKNETGYDAYNAGVDGNGIILQYGILELLLERYTPRIIIYDISRFDFYLDDNTKYLENLKPFYDNENIKTIFHDVSPLSNIKMISGFYRYNSSFFNLLSDCIIKRDGIKNCGYQPLFQTMGENDQMEEADETEIDSLKIYYFQKFIDLCNERGIKVLFFISPTYKIYIPSDYYATISNLCKERNVPLYDFSEDENLVSVIEYYKDFTHLNNTGAVVFTHSVAQIIKEYLVK